MSNKRNRRKNLDGKQFETSVPKFRDDVVVSAKTKGQKDYIMAVKNNEITFCFGPAGSGKSCIAVGLGLQYILSSNSNIEKIIVLRPAKEACDEKIGYLPGDITEKMTVWAAPIVDNMEVFIDKKQIRNILMDQKVEIIPLAFLRGRSLNNAFIIVDEAQNCTEQQMLMILTRIGENSKMVINGDIDQTDLRYRNNEKNGMVDGAERLEGLKGVEIVNLDGKDIVRNKLISSILDRYTDKVSYDTNDNLEVDDSNLETEDSEELENACI